MIYLGIGTCSYYVDTEDKKTKQLTRSKKRNASETFSADNYYNIEEVMHLAAL